MIEYERIDILEGIDINKTNKSKECCMYYFLTNYSSLSMPDSASLLELSSDLVSTKSSLM